MWCTTVLPMVWTRRFAFNKHTVDSSSNVDSHHIVNCSLQTQQLSFLLCSQYNLSKHRVQALMNSMVTISDTHEWVYIMTWFLDLVAVSVMLNKWQWVTLASRQMSKKFTGTGMINSKHLSKKCVYCIIPHVVVTHEILSTFIFCLVK